MIREESKRRRVARPSGFIGPKWSAGSNQWEETERAQQGQPLAVALELQFVYLLYASVCVCVEEKREKKSSMA